LILNFLSEIDYLATNQGLVGSNPAGRAKIRYKFKGLRARACRPFSCAVPLDLYSAANGTICERIDLGPRDAIHAPLHRPKSASRRRTRDARRPSGNEDVSG
jgi:hypothetical protein